MLFVSDDLPFVAEEMASYMWKRDAHDTPLDEPKDENDHSLDTIKYMLSDAPEIGSIMTRLEETPAWMKWHAVDHTTDYRKPRYG
jgi:hypothetical protein